MAKTASRSPEDKVIPARGNKPLTKELLFKLYRDMLMIRRFEEKAGQLYGMGLIGGFCHLYIGQEAVVVGMQDCITPDDAVITSSPSLTAICMPTTTASWPI